MASSARSLLLNLTIPTRKTVMSFLSSAGYIISDVASRRFSSEAAEKRPKPIAPSIVKRRFESWCRKHGKTYPSEEEKCRRMKIFGDNLAFVIDHNNSANSYTVGLYSWADHTFEEYWSKCRSRGDRPTTPVLPDPQTALTYELRNTMYKLFERKSNWSMKELLQETDQTLNQLVQETDDPAQILKKKKKCLKEKFVDEMCVYNKNGAKRGTYEIRGYFKRSSEYLKRSSRDLSICDCASVGEKDPEDEGVLEPKPENKKLGTAE